MICVMMFMYLMFKPTSGGGRTRNFYAEHFALVYKHLLIGLYIYDHKWTSLIRRYKCSTTVCLSKRSYMYIAIIGRSVRCLADTCRSAYGFFFLHEEQQFEKKITHQHYLFQQNTVNLFFKHDL